MLGTFASYWKNDREKKKIFLRECSEMCRSKMFEELWGPDLVASIVEFSKIQETKAKMITGLNYNIIEAIKHLRIEKGLKQCVIANILGMTQGNYCKLERCLVPITIMQVEIIAEVLNMSFLDILTLAKSQKSESDSPKQVLIEDYSFNE